MPEGALFRLRCGGLYYYYTAAVSSSRVSPYIRALALSCVCRHTHALVVLNVMYVSRVSRYRHAPARTCVQ